MTTEREERLIAETQDRMLREADGALFGYDERTCEECGDFESMPHRDFRGYVYRDGLSEAGVCHRLDCVCDREAPACEWWS